MNTQEYPAEPAVCEALDAPACGSADAVSYEAAADTVSTSVFPAAETADPRADRLAAASFVCGLIGVILLPLGLIPGFFGLALNMDARSRGSRHARLDSGRILCIIAMAGMPLLCAALLAYSCEAALMMI